MDVKVPCSNTLESRWHSVEMRRGKRTSFLEEVASRMSGADHVKPLSVAVGSWGWMQGSFM